MMNTLSANVAAAPCVARARATSAARASSASRVTFQSTRGTSARLGGRGRASDVRGLTRRGDEVTRTRSLLAEDVELEEGEMINEKEETRTRQFFAAATGLFSPAVFNSSSAKGGPACLLSTSDDGDEDGDFISNGGSGSGDGAKQPPQTGRRLGSGILALALGVAGFGTVGGGHRSLPMEQAAHAAVLTTSSSSSSASYSTSSASLAASRSSSSRPSAKYASKYSNSLLPAAVTTSGAARAHPDHIGFVPNPHFEDMICSRWFVGSMNALG